jgi:outer membrane protein assembly factor BamE (lipoprotein component of BamABCDE complex)
MPGTPSNADTVTRSRLVRYSSHLENAILAASDLQEREMKALAVLAAVTVCLTGLTACGTSKNYEAMYVHGWTRDSMDKRFPTGTTQRQVVDRLGYPYQAIKADGVERWDYSGGKTSKQKISFGFRDGKLVEKRYENF